MEVEFDTADLRKLCEDDRFALRQLGKPSAKKLQNRIADLFAATRLGELQAGNPHPLKGNRKGQFSIGLADGARLVLVPADDSLPTFDDGAIDWKDVRAVRVIFIGDYHD